MRVVQYKCDQCGGVGPWVKGVWVALIVLFGRGYRGWEHEFHFCSDECCDEFVKRPKKEMEKLSYLIK